LQENNDYKSLLKIALRILQKAFDSNNKEKSLLLRGDMSDVTQILNAIEQGDARAVDKLLPAVYDELRRLAAWKLSQERPGQTLQATALVHEAYIRLVSAEKQQDWKSRTHFFSAAAEAMRRILIENARRKQRLKRGGDQQKVDFEAAELAIKEPSEDVIALDEALNKLESIEKVKSELVKLRYFTGLTLEQAAELLGISITAAKRHWVYARTWLYREISKSE
jgi:RNA polymerase sigma factor (TIGR02999 family)